VLTLFTALTSAIDRRRVDMQAADLFAGEEQTSEANKCRLKVSLSRPTRETMVASTNPMKLSEQEGGHGVQID
jgi:hypothetical protein